VNRNGNKAESFAGNFVASNGRWLFFEVPFIKPRAGCGSDSTARIRRVATGHLLALGYRRTMWQVPTFIRGKPAMLALQANVERAGGAWACAYSSSDEFEAAVIRAKFGPGASGPRRRRWFALYAAVATLIAVLALLMV
jgi:hypothetical protein